MTLKRDKEYPRAVDYINARRLLLKALKCSCKTDEEKRVFDIVKANRDNSYASFSLDRKRCVSYSNPGIYKYDYRRRVVTKINRWLRRLVDTHSIPFNDITLERLGARVLSHLRTQQDFEVVSGSDLMAVYDQGFAYSACMSGTHAREYREIYEDNPNTVKMLKYDDGEQRGRALLWFLPDATLLDRIYPNSGDHVQAMRDWALECGYWVRSHQGCPDEDYVAFCNKDNKRRHDFTVTLDWNNFKLPYVDSFHWAECIDEDDAQIVLSTSDSVGNTRLDSTEGGWSDSYDCCEGCGYTLPRSYRTDEDGCLWCEDCFDDRFTYCEDVERYVVREVATYVEDGYYVLNDYFTCRKCDLCFDSNIHHSHDINLCDECESQAIADETEARMEHL